MYIIIVDLSEDMSKSNYKCLSVKYIIFFGAKATLKEDRVWYYMRIRLVSVPEHSKLSMTMFFYQLCQTSFSYLGLKENCVHIS